MCDSSEEIPLPLSAVFVGTFAHVTIRDRLPIILSKVVDTMAREKHTILETYGPDACEQLKEMIGRLSKLRNEIQTDKDVVPLVDRRSDTELWNDAIRQAEVKQNDGTLAPPSWFTSPWLLVECYMYRRIQESLELTSRLKSLDPFSSQKTESFLSSVHVIGAIGEQLQSAVQRVSKDGLQFEVFNNFVQIDLWGNKCDLSISAGKVDSDHGAVAPLQLDKLLPNILANDTPLLWNTVRSGISRMDFILDNAGFELFTDLCLADLLCSSGKVKRVNFHVKQMPWFVSDTTERDFHWTLQSVEKAGSMTAPLRQLAKRWTNYLEQGRWQVCSHLFWTLPHDFTHMSRLCPELHRDLSDSQLLIFKGDLNYRKLTGDLQWEPTTPFDKALRNFRPTSLCTLRTIKADVVVGLQPGQAEATQKLQENWMTSGDFAVIEFSSGNH